MERDTYGISIKKVCKTYENQGQKIQVFHNLNLYIPKSKITVILGKSGCGKTTLLRVIAGLEKVEAGDISLPNGKVGMVFQEPRLMDWLTVEENIRFGVRSKEIDISKFLRLTKLEPFAYLYPRQLSGGMQQRVSLARALAYNPDILLMDEPFAALDYFTRENLQQDLLKIYNVMKLTIVFITHNIEEAIALGHQIILLGNGKTSCFSLEHLDFPRMQSTDEIINMKEYIREEIARC